MENVIPAPRYVTVPDLGMRYSSKEKLWTIPSTFLVPKASPLHARIF